MRKLGISGELKKSSFFKAREKIETHKIYPKVVSRLSSIFSAFELLIIFSFLHCPLNCMLLWFSINPGSQQGHPVEMKHLMICPTFRKISVRAALLWVMLWVNLLDEESIPSIEIVRGKVWTEEQARETGWIPRFYWVKFFQFCFIMLFEINSQNIRCCHTFLKSLKVPYKCYLTDQDGQSFFPCNQRGNNQELMLVKWGIL